VVRSEKLGRVAHRAPHSSAVPIGRSEGRVRQWRTRWDYSGAPDRFIWLYEELDGINLDLTINAIRQSGSVDLP
jgi:hypothetical protein